MWSCIPKTEFLKQVSNSTRNLVFLTVISLRTQAMKFEKKSDEIILLRFYLLHQAIGVFSDWLSITLLLIHINRKSFSACYDSYMFDLHPAPTHVHVVSFLTQVWYFALHIELTFLEFPSHPGKSCEQLSAMQRPIEQLRPLLYSPRMPNR